MSSFNPYKLLVNDQESPAEVNQQPDVVKKNKHNPAPMPDLPKQDRLGGAAPHVGAGARGGRGGRGGRPPKREFDRQSGSGRDGSARRDGQGAYNWGASGSEIAATSPSADDGAVSSPAEVVADSSVQDAEAKEAPPAEEEDTGISLEQAKKIIDSKRIAGDGEFNARSAGEGEKDDGKLKAFAKSDEPDDILGLAGEKKEKIGKKEQKSKQIIEIEPSMPRQRAERPERSDSPRGGRGGFSPRGRGGDLSRGRGRGAPRGNRGAFRGGYEGVAHEAQFPSLGK